MENASNVSVETLAAKRRDLEFELREQLPSYQEHTNLISKTLGEAPLRSKGLNQTNRILVALGIVLNGSSQSAIEFAITRAVNHGANEEMIKDVLDVAMLTGGGHVVSNVRFAYEALKFRIVKPTTTEEFLSGAERVYNEKKRKLTQKVS
jgi:alkylhydroperoxidase/carboxymuconolactone decarboxylase family protein YurZ